MSKTDIFVSVIALLPDDAKIIDPFIQDVRRVLDESYTNFEILLVENGVQNPGVAVVRNLLTSERCIRLIRLSRQLERETAITAGLDAAIGDFVVIMDPDLDPHDEIPAMVDLCRSGDEVVLGVDRERRVGPIYRLFRKIFLRLTRRLVRLELVIDTTGFRVLNRQVVNAMTQIRRRDRYFPLIATEVGFTPKIHPYRRISRSGRKAHPNLRHAMRTGASVIIYNSNLPLRWVSMLGLTGSLLSFVYSLIVIVVYFVRKDVPLGWAPLSLQISGLLLLVFIIQMLIGEYIGRFLEEASDRPLYHVREEAASSVILAAPARLNVLDHSIESSGNAARPGDLPDGRLSHAADVKKSPRESASNP
ncbi:MAG: glycosyltransferase [Isosphaeraceae bacterium]